MKYIKVIVDYAIQKDEISKQDLVEVLDGRCSCLIEIENQKYFNAGENKWEDIKNVTPIL